MFEQAFSRQAPGCLVILVDRSDSMGSMWPQASMTLAEGTARAINRMLIELCIKSMKDSRLAHYFDIGVFGYGLCPNAGGEGVESALSGPLAGRGIVPLPTIADNPVAVREEPSIVTGVPGGRAPVWVEPAHGYRAPMCQAIAVAGAHIYDWVNDHPQSFPPIVINITDGMANDEPYEGAYLRDWANRLTSIATQDGPTLLLNIFLSASASQEIQFPTSAEHLPSPGPELFSISSVLPPSMAANASQWSPVPIGARGFCFNAGPESLVRLLQVGTRFGRVYA